MTKDPINPDYIINEAIKILKQAESTSIERPLKVKMLIADALKVLRQNQQ